MQPTIAPLTLIFHRIPQYSSRRRLTISKLSQRPTKTTRGRRIPNRQWLDHLVHSFNHRPSSLIAAVVYLSMALLRQCLRTTLRHLSASHTNHLLDHNLQAYKVLTNRRGLNTPKLDSLSILLYKVKWANHLLKQALCFHHSRSLLRIRLVFITNRLYLCSIPRSLPLRTTGNTQGRMYKHQILAGLEDPLCTRWSFRRDNPFLHQ